MPTSRTLRITGLTLHVLLVVLSTATFTVWARGLEQRVWFPTDSMDRSLLYIQGGLQVFTVLYEAGMLVTTQQLAMKIHLSRYQYLTTTHDVALAWTGLGASLMSLAKQLKLPVSTRQVIPIVSYLGCLALLHITIPTLFSVFLGDALAGHVFSVGSTLGLPLSDVEGNKAMVSASAQSLATLPALMSLQNTVTTPGLIGNTVYDVLDDEAQSGVGSAQVNMSSFEVSCGTVPTVSLNTTAYHNSTARNFAASVTFGNETWAFQWVPWSHEVIRLPDVTDFVISPDSHALPLSPVQNYPDFLLYSTLNFTDSEGNVGTTRSIADVVDINFIKGGYQFVGCHVSLKNGTGTVDLQTKALLYPPPRKTSATWAPFTPYGNKTDNPWLELWQFLLNYRRASRPLSLGQNRGLLNDCEAPLIDSDCLFTAPELYIMDDLGFADGSTPSANLLLHVLENSLANMTAAVVWATAHSSAYNASSRATRGQSLVSEHVGRLRLNKLQVILTFVGSIIAMVCSVLLTWGDPDDIDTPGILQVMWMVRANEASVPDGGPGRFDIMRTTALAGHHSAPSDYELRRAGTVKMRLHAHGTPGTVHHVGSGNEDAYLMKSPWSSRKHLVSDSTSL